jgi:methylmalonyl-CoA mutase
VLGGVDSLHIAPHDEASGRTDDISRRIARNIHTLLAEEFHFTAPADAAGGSWCVESLTDELARQAWSVFQAVERQGGMIKALEAGEPQRLVAAASADKAAALATRRSTLIGTNIFPNLRDKLPASRRAEREARRITRGRAAQERRGATGLAPVEGQAWPECLQAARAAARDGATIGQLSRLGRKRAESGPALPPLAVHRAAEPFEVLRSRAAELREKPRVFLAKMGPVAQHKARADFTLGFFAVGGFEALAKRSFDHVEEAAKAAVESGAPVTVLCSTDETYPELVPAFARAVKAAKPGLTVVVAGLPADAAVVAAYRAAGVDEFIHVRADVVALLGKLLAQMEVSS